MLTRVYAGTRSEHFHTWTKARKPTNVKCEHLDEARAYVERLSLASVDPTVKASGAPDGEPLQALELLFPENILA